MHARSCYCFRTRRRVQRSGAQCAGSRPDLQSYKLTADARPVQTRTTRRRCIAAMPSLEKGVQQKKIRLVHHSSMTNNNNVLTSQQ